MITETAVLHISHIVALKVVNPSRHRAISSHFIVYSADFSIAVEDKYVTLESIAEMYGDKKN